MREKIYIIYMFNVRALPGKIKTALRWRRSQRLKSQHDEISSRRYARP